MSFDFKDNLSWARVRVWPALQAECKLACLFLWEQTDGKAGDLSCHVAAVGKCQGSADPSRYGRRLLQQLADRRLIQILKKNTEALWRLQVYDPAEVAQQPPPAPNDGPDRPAA